MSKTPAGIIHAHLGTTAMAEALGVTPNMIRRRAHGLFPSSWYPVVRALCEEHGIACPEVAFKWRPRATSP